MEDNLTSNVTLRHDSITCEEILAVAGACFSFEPKLRPLNPCTEHDWCHPGDGVCIVVHLGSKVCSPPEKCHFSTGCPFVGVGDGPITSSCISAFWKG